MECKSINSRAVTNTGDEVAQCTTRRDVEGGGQYKTPASEAVMKWYEVQEIRINHQEERDVMCTLVYFFGSSAFFSSAFLSSLAPVDKISLIFSNGWPLMREATLAQPRCNNDLISM